MKKEKNTLNQYIELAFEKKNSEKIVEKFEKKEKTVEELMEENKKKTPEDWEKEGQSYIAKLVRKRNAQATHGFFNPDAKPFTPASSQPEKTMKI